MNARLVAALLAPALFAVAPAATAQNGTQVRPCQGDPSALCVYGQADFTAEGREIRILAEAEDDDVKVRGDENDIGIEDGFGGELDVIGDENTIDGSDRSDRIATAGCRNTVKARAFRDFVNAEDRGGCTGPVVVIRAGRGVDKVEIDSDEPAIVRGERDPDHIDGGGGDDRLYGGVGGHVQSIIEGRAGDDRIRGGPKGEFLIRGGRGDDRIKGGKGSDTIFGNHGHDTLHGNTGYDGVYGNRGRDRVFGGKGDDREVSGGNGDDLVDGGRGDEGFIRLFAGIFGGPGQDVLKGGGGDDRLTGQKGDDIVRGNTGDDKLDGKRGRDRLLGGKGSDRLRGGKHNDILNGGRGQDHRCKGDRGRDVARRCG